ncbi:MAG: tetratricopeptide repeat protein [Rhodobacteraceae bacterium]|nr:tetratricopeptide repeat protein [Paracoccaceae bacterium]
MQMLRAEVEALRDIGAPAAPGLPPAPLSGPILDRVQTIEAELRRLTRATEALELQIRQTTQGAGARLDALAARLAALDGGAAVAMTDAPPAVLSGPRRPVARPAPQLATAEQAAFDAAQAALDAGDLVQAAAGFADFANAYPGGPLTPRAHLGRGRALAGLGDLPGAARAWLDAFSAAPDAAAAPEALFALADALARLDKPAEACLTYAELPQRFPASPEAAAVGPRMRALDCS